MDYTPEQVNEKIEKALLCYVGELITTDLQEEVWCIMQLMMLDPNVFDGIQRDKW